LLQALKQVLMVLSQGVVSIAENNFKESISCALRSLRAQLTARIECRKKKFCWIKKIR
jgi:hypothetical protein